MATLHTGSNGSIYPPPSNYAGRSVYAQLTYVPPEPRNAQEAGIPDYMVHDLFLRHLLQRSVTNISEISGAMRQPVK